MSRALAADIEEQTRVLLHNVDTMLRTCVPEAVLCGMPVWKHAYHLLHSLDCWFINPERYTEPLFHQPGLNSLDIPNNRVLTREDLCAYFSTVREKIAAYAAALTDEQLAGKPEGCIYSRLTLVLGQFRHVYAHLGNINAVTILQTGEWPRVVGLEDRLEQSLYE